MIQLDNSYDVTVNVIMGIFGAYLIWDALHDDDDAEYADDETYDS